MKTAVIYARYSSERQTEQSIEGQVHVCNEYAQRNNILILDTYIDRAMTGTNDNRTDFQRMLKDSAKQGWDYVLVYKLDRFSRNKYEMAMHKKTLRDNGVKLLSAMENIPDTPEGIILESLLEGSDSADGKMISYRLRLRDSYGNLLLPIHVGDTQTTEIKNNHNSLYFLPEEKYGTAYPEFYSGTGQLCYTAHGNEKGTYDKMTTLCAEKIEQSLMWYPAAEYPQYKAVLLGQMDNVPMCSCTACATMKNEHNDANSAALMKFMHDVGKKVDAWMALEENAAYRRENFKYMFFAYLDTSRPPFVEDSNGNIDIAEDLKFDDGVNVAPFFAQSHLHTGVSFDDKANIEQKEYIRLWGKAFPGTWAWSYGGFYNDFFTFWDLYSFYPGYYKYLKANNYSLTFPQIKSCQTGADTGFNVLAIYMYSKLAWNSELSVENIFDEYFNAMYAEAAEPMREMFDDLRLWFGRCLTDNNWTWSANMNGSISGSMEFVKQGDIVTMFRHLDEAYSKIEMYKKDPAKYSSLKSHIDMEWLFPAKVSISTDTGLFTEKQLANIKTNFKTYVRTLGMRYIKEFTSIEPFLNSL